MKAKSFFMLIATALFVMTSCDPHGPNQDESGEFKLNPEELTLSFGQSTRLNATIDGKTITTGIVWSSDNDEIVTVESNGTITANEYTMGEATITATYKEQTATCKVKVTDFYHNTTFTQCTYAAIDTTYNDSIFEIQARAGQTYKCYKALATVYLFSDGLYINDEGYFDGTEEGLLIEFQAPIYYGSAANNNGSGVVFCLGDWGIGEDWWNAGLMQAGKPGYIEDEAAYVQAIHAGFESYLKEDVTGARNNWEYAGSLCKGALMNMLTYSYDAETQQGGYSQSFVPDGFVKNAYFYYSGKDGASGWMNVMDSVQISIDQFDQSTLWGMGADLEVDEANNQINLLSKKVLWEQEPLVYEYVSGAIEEGYAPARRINGATKQNLYQVHVLSLENPKAYKNFMKSLKTRKF